MAKPATRSGSKKCTDPIPYSSYIRMVSLINSITVILAPYAEKVFIHVRHVCRIYIYYVNRASEESLRSIDGKSNNNIKKLFYDQKTPKSPVKKQTE